MVLYDKESARVKGEVNNAAVQQPDGSIKYNVPRGAHIQNEDGNGSSYTHRGQLNYSDVLGGRHRVVALAGAEQRRVMQRTVGQYRMGYNDMSLEYTPINPLELTQVGQTQALTGYYTYSEQDKNFFYETEDRFVSFYSNASYTFDDRYSVTGSIRVDQSNLFGTAPSLQWKPLWSVGVGWSAKDEHFLRDVSWLDRLNFRMTYGINGNVVKEYGSYMTLRAGGYNDWVDGFSNIISQPANPLLRLEKTSALNFGMDFAVLGSRLMGTIDVYSKWTNDLLGPRAADPTLGWTEVNVNYGSMVNRGVEVGLNSLNLSVGIFSWTSDFTFSYNYNEVTRVDNSSLSTFDLVKRPVEYEGYPVGALFSYRYAGLNEQGVPQVYDANDSIHVNLLGEMKDLVYSGTTIAPFAASLNNTLSLGDFDLSFLLVYYGGHVMRVDEGSYIQWGIPSSNGYDKRTLELWQAAGDEADKSRPPAINAGTSQIVTQSWYSADMHVQPADFIKLRSVTLGYNLPERYAKRVRLTSANVSVQVNNPLKWVANKNGSDPEAMSYTQYHWARRGVPIPTTYTVRVAVMF